MGWNFFDAWRPKRLPREHIPCTEPELLAQTTHCNELYDDWNLCVAEKGFNDEQCKEGMEPYYTCIAKMQAMQAYLEDKDLD